MLSRFDTKIDTKNLQWFRANSKIIVDLIQLNLATHIQFHKHTDVYIVWSCILYNGLNHRVCVVVSRVCRCCVFYFDSIDLLLELEVYRCTKRSRATMTSSNGNIISVTGSLCGEFTGPGEFPAQRPVTRSFDVFFDLRLNKPLSKQPWGRWFETPSWSLWRQCNGILMFELVQLFRTEDIVLTVYTMRLSISPWKRTWYTGPWPCSKMPSYRHPVLQ